MIPKSVLCCGGLRPHAELLLLVLDEHGSRGRSRVNLQEYDARGVVGDDGLTGAELDEEERREAQCGEVAVEALAVRGEAELDGEPDGGGGVLQGHGRQQDGGLEALGIGGVVGDPGLPQPPPLGFLTRCRPPDGRRFALIARERR